MEEIDLKDILKIFWNKKIIIIFITIIFIVLGSFYSYEYIKPEYTSSTTLVLTTSEGKSKNETNTITTTDITLNSKLVSTYSELLKSKNVVRQVISNLKMNIEEDELKNNIQVSQVKSTEMIKISVTSKKPSDSSKIANEMAKVFIEKVSEIYNINNVHIVDEAEVNTDPSNINHIKDISIFAIIGIIISMFLISLGVILDTTIKTPEQVEKKFKIPVVASTPLYVIKNRKKKDKNSAIKKELIVQKEPKSPISEIFRTLRTNIQFMNTNKRLKTILVTSTFPGEGKSWISSNLAVTFAQAGKKVILIDADMRKGRLYTIFGISPKPGLSNILSEMNKDEENNVDITKYIQGTEVKNLLIMPAGNTPPNPSELLASSQMRTLLGILKSECDIIIIDGTPCELVTDSVILSRTVDSTIIVTAYKKTKKDYAERAIKSIQNVGGKLAGVVINKMPFSAKKYSETYYYSDYNVESIEENNMNLNDEIEDTKNKEKKVENKEEVKKEEKTESKEQMDKKEKVKDKEQEEKIENFKEEENLEDIVIIKNEDTEQEQLKQKTNDILNQLNSYLEQEKRELEE